MKQELTRRKFFRTAGISGGAALAGSQQWTPRFFRERLAELGKPSLPTKHKPAPETWSDNALTASWLGHSTVLINFYGINILTDPVLFPRVGADFGIATLGPRRRVAPALSARELPKIDVVLLSHAHLDHFDIPSLRRLPRSAHVVTAKRTADLLDGIKFSGATELAWGQKTALQTKAGAIEIQAFEVRHWGARWRHDTWRGYNGYVLARGGKKIIFGGDTAFSKSFSALKSRHAFDLACMPIGAYNPWINSHCNPEEALRMANEAGARHILPIHHYTFRFGRELCTEPLERLEAALQAEPERLALREAGQTFQIS